MVGRRTATTPNFLTSFRPSFIALLLYVCLTDATANISTRIGSSRQYANLTELDETILLKNSDLPVTLPSRQTQATSPNSQCVDRS